MSFWGIVVLIVWGIIGFVRYVECEDEDGNGINPDLDGYTFYTILVHGPFWWLVKICVTIWRLLCKMNWSWFGRIFVIEKKEKR